jgi:hypothetical protein
MCNQSTQSMTLLITKGEEAMTLFPWKMLCVRAASISIVVSAVTQASPALALAFDPTCRVHQAVHPVAPQDAILFTKQPVPHPNGTATAHDLINLNNHVIPAGANSCILVHPAAGGDFCFQARSDATILTIGIAAIRNPGGLTPCQ